MRIVGSELGGGIFATLVLTTILRGAAEAGLTRMDLALLLGTIVTDSRSRAKVVGYLIHFGLGILFAFLYGALFTVLGRSGWQLGAVIGAVHATFMSTVLVNELLPAVHPRMGTPESAANHAALIEPPGFLMLNYGRNTFLVTLVAHVVYGMILGWSVRV